ncbi:MAG: response regulator transcription factor [Phenylobacterium sp.]
MSNQIRRSPADSSIRTEYIPLVGPFYNKLTTRQLEVALCVIAGDSNKQIAHQLGISTSTVADHVGRLLIVAGVRSRSLIGPLANQRVLD